jgi:hypothetical protein
MDGSYYLGRPGGSVSTEKTQMTGNGVTCLQAGEYAIIHQSYGFSSSVLRNGKFVMPW